MGKKNKKNLRTFNSYEEIEQHVKATSVLDTVDVLENNVHGKKASYLVLGKINYPLLKYMFVFNGAVYPSDKFVFDAIAASERNEMLIACFRNMFIKDKIMNYVIDAKVTEFLSIERPFIEIEGLIAIIVMFDWNTVMAQREFRLIQCVPMHETELGKLVTSRSFPLKNKTIDELREETLMSFDQIEKNIYDVGIEETLSVLISNYQISEWVKIEINGSKYVLPGVKATCSFALVYNTNDGPLHDLKEEIDDDPNAPFYQLLVKCAEYRLSNNDLCLGHTELLAFEKPIVYINNLIAILVKIEAFRQPNEGFHRLSCSSLPEEIIEK